MHETPYFKGFRGGVVNYLKLADWLAGDAVVSEPVSTQFPC